MYRYLFTLILFASTLIVAAETQDGPKNAIVVIIRHAEDADTGNGLSPRGEQRAEAYKDYFLKFTVGSKSLQPNVIFAAKDSKKSHKPHLTVEPFANAQKLRIDTRFGNNQSAELAATLRATEQGKRILICWRHPYIPALLSALGANPASLLPVGKWPGHVYNWVILLSYDQEGHLIPAETKRINEQLLPGDSQ